GSRISWVTGHVSGKGKMTDTHPSPDYAMGQYEFENGVRGIIECGELSPDMSGDNRFWLNAGATVYGSEGYAQVIAGSGWRAVTRTSDGMISGPGIFNEDVDQVPYIRDLADWLDDPEKVHPCNGDVSYHGFQAVMGICLSALEKCKVDLPLETGKPILRRLA
ncbi:gfo/Idh/MocA family oxidoreductase, partial [Candidatus Hydrogenedentota bacterium]